MGITAPNTTGRVVVVVELVDVWHWLLLSFDPHEGWVVVDAVVAESLFTGVEPSAKTK
jgi:hypothetical protein